MAEKQPLLSHGYAQELETCKKADRRIFRRRLTVASLFLLTYLGVLFLYDHIKHPQHFNDGLRRPPSYRPLIQHAPFSWRRVPSLMELSYQRCYPEADVKFECARLSVPLDHFNDTTDAEVSLAILRLPAPVPPTHEQYGGAILFNPGGPGGSGVDFLQRGYAKIAAALYEGQNYNSTRYYDFISFDPRGVGLSTPKLQCFTSASLSWAWDLRVMTEGILGSSDAAFGRLWSMSQASGGSCSRFAMSDPEDIKRYVSTASVAADMIEIIEKHGQWREAEVRRLLGCNTDDEAVQVPEHLKYKPGKEMLNYWGFSYGTYLGMTFASMYPNRVNRLIVDGVVDAVDYTKSLWFDNLADTEKEMQSFYNYCASAGYPACALANATGQTNSATVKARVSKIVDSLVHNPLPVIGNNPEIATYSDAKNLIFAALYTPMQSFPLVANILLDVESGNGSSLAAVFKSSHEPYCPSDRGDDIFTIEKDKVPRHVSSRQEEASIAIACSDGDPQDELTRAEFRKHWDSLVEISPTIGPIWAAFRMHCVHYTVRAQHRYAGPWQGNTSFPLLFIGNSADPVTPVRNAYKLSKGFKNAKVLEQGSSGHCSISAPSKCTRQIIHNYFQHGVLPEKDTYCEADEVPFGAQSISTRRTEQLFQWHLPGGVSSILTPVL